MSIEKNDQTDESAESAKAREKKNRANAATFCTSSLSLCAFSIADLSGGQTDFESVIGALEEPLTRLCKGDARAIEVILGANALTLDMLYNNLLRMATTAMTGEAAVEHFELALRAQDSLRKTLLALDQVKRPKQQITQTNIAGVQQVNNNLMHSSPDISNLQIKLTNIETGGPKHGTRTEALDARAKGTSIQADTREADLVPLHRRTDT